MISRSQKNSMSYNKNVNKAMNKTTNDNSKVSVTLDLVELWNTFVKKLFSVILCMLIGGVSMFCISTFVIRPKYESQATIFLTPKIVENVVDYSSMNSNKMLVNNVVSLLKQNNLMNEIAETLDLESAEVVKNYLTVKNISGTELVSITAVTTDPKLSQKVVSTTLSKFIQSMKKNLNVSNIEIVDSPRVNKEPISPNILKNTAFGVILGFLIAFIRIFIIVLTDKTIKNKTEAEKFFGYPVYVELPKLK